MIVVESRDALEAELDARLEGGWRVESDAGDRVVVARGLDAAARAQVKPNHLLHLLLCLPTLGLWIIPWAVMSLRRANHVDSSGRARELGYVVRELIVVR